jgi:Fic family protein
MAQTPDRPYKRSHPWITFRVDLARAGAEFWMLLGEGRSKVDHLSLALLKPDIAEEMNHVYLAKGAQATAAIEGNTLSEEEVKAIVAGRAGEPQPSQQYLYQEIENALAAFNRIKDDLIAGGSTDISVQGIEQFNAEVLNGLERPDVTPGVIRRRSVGVGRYRGAPWEDCEYLLAQLSEWLNGDSFAPPNPDWKIPYALIKAAVAHLYIAWIHPFDDGNGRTARLMELQILLAAGVPMPAAHLLSNHYNATRSEYYRQLEAASESGGDIVPFVQYALQGFVDGIRVQMQRVWVQNYTDRWEQFIYESFGGNVTTDAERRRLRLILAMTELDEEEVSRRQLAGLTPELERAYFGTERMLSRDLNALESLGLIEQSRHGFWRLRREQILAFRPLRREAP